MQASRVLRSTVNSKGFLIPPRTSWDLFASAGHAVFSLISSQDSRNDYDKLLQKGTIQQNVLGRAGQPMGTAMILSLYNDLNSPVLQKYGFDTTEFLSGVKPALEQFHNVHGNLMNLMHEESTKLVEGDDNTEPTEEEQLSFDTLKNDRQASLMAAMLGMTQDTKLLRKFLKVHMVDWIKIAEETPDSLAGQLKQMVTSEFFAEMHNNAQARQIIEDSLNKVVIYEDESSEVNNVALLSARTMVLDIQDSRKPELDIERLKDSDLSTANPVVDDGQGEVGEILNGIKGSLPIAAQVEVLYEIKNSLTFKKIKKDEIGESPDASPQSSKDVTVLVAVLEGWLSGNPDGKDEVRWKLVSSRFPWEFSSMNPS